MGGMVMIRMKWNGALGLELLDTIAWLIFQRLAGWFGGGIRLMIMTR